VSPALAILPLLAPGVALLLLAAPLGYAFAADGLAVASLVSSGVLLQRSGAPWLVAPAALVLALSAGVGDGSALPLSAAATALLFIPLLSVSALLRPERAASALLLLFLVLLHGRVPAPSSSPTVDPSMLWLWAPLAAAAVIVADRLLGARAAAELAFAAARPGPAAAMGLGGAGWRFFYGSVGVVLAASAGGGFAVAQAFGLPPPSPLGAAAALAACLWLAGARLGPAFLAAFGVFTLPSLAAPLFPDADVRGLVALGMLALSGLLALPERAARSMAGRTAAGRRGEA